MPSPQQTKSGFVAIVGRPNVGKSTLLNKIVGADLAIVTPKPQTTRNRIRGILTRGQMQAVFLDTPGIHHAREGINKRMVRAALSTISEVDLILHMIEIGAPDDIDKLISAEIAKSHRPSFLVINKIDTMQKDKLLPEIDRLKDRFTVNEIVPISAKTGNGVDLLIKLVEKYLPDGPHFYPPDDFTDVTERFIAGEIIREQIILNTHQELPYATAVEIEEFKEEPEIVRIRARIYVETPSQKGIMIGAGGTMLKQIGTYARKKIEAMVGTKVFLGLQVEVLPKWRRDEEALDKLGYGENR